MKSTFFFELVSQYFRSTVVYKWQRPLMKNTLLIFQFRSQKSLRNFKAVIHPKKNNIFPKGQTFRYCNDILVKQIWISNFKPTAVFIHKINEFRKIILLFKINTNKNYKFKIITNFTKRIFGYIKPFLFFYTKQNIIITVLKGKLRNILK